jgi:hypothetical protein
MDKVSWASTSFVIPKSELMLLRAGDIMDDDIGETRVKQETIKVAAHFRFIDPARC